MLSIERARDILRVDHDDGELSALIESLLLAIPDYIEVTTGMPRSQQLNEPLVDTVSGFLLTLWFESNLADDKKLQRTIDNLLKCITIKAKAAQ